jgi:hypothetical protein
VKTRLILSGLLISLLATSATLGQVSSLPGILGKVDRHSAGGKPETRPTGWLTGSALQKRLSGSVNIDWGGNPLRQALRGLSEAQQVAVLVDRRVDPGRRIDLQLTATPLATALHAIANGRQLGVSQFGPVAYFGPPGATARLRTLALLREEEVERLSPNAARKFLAKKPLAWEDFATPKDLLGRLADDAGIELAGLDRVPHDLWAAADLPPLSLLDRLTLIVNQFDLTFQVSEDGSKVRLVPVPEDVGITRSYSAGQNAEATAKKYAALVPTAKITVAGGKVVVRGMLEDHERISPPRDPSESAGKEHPSGPMETRIDRLVIKEKPLGPVLEQLAVRLNFQLRMDRAAIAAAGISLDQRVSVHVERATVDDVLRELFKNTRLNYDLKGNVVTITPR